MAYNPNAAGVQANAKLGFKVGTQTALDSLLAASVTAAQNNTQGPAVHGSFYLTSDTHRLYVGNSNGTLSPVNEGIITVNSLSDMPSPSAANAGQFYYITGESDTVKNVLTVSNGHQWVHINANTNTYISDHTFTSVDITDGAQLEDNIIGTDNSTKTGRFHIKGANGTTVSRSSTTITVNGQSVTVPVITVTGDTYTLSSAAVSGQTNQVDIKLDSTNTSNDSKVTLAAANDPQGNATVGISENNGVISISARDTRNASVTVANGNQTASPTTTTGFTVQVQDNYGATKQGAFDPKIQLGTNTPVSFNNGTATLNVYTKDEVDATLKVLNAMTYRGTLGDGGTAATSLNGTTWYPQISDGQTTTPVNVSVGDTFLVISPQTYDGHAVPVNSLLIARGTEDPTTGYITSNLSYDIVESTADTDTTYKFQATANGLYLQPKTGGTAGEIAFASGNAITVSFSASDAGSGTGAITNGKQTVTVTHSNVTRTDPTVTSETGAKASSTAAGQTTIPVVTAVSTNDQGHVTGVTVKNYIMSDTNAKITNNVTEASNYASSGKNVGVVKNTLTTTYGNGSSSSTESFEAISSESLTITTDNSNQKSLTNADTVAGLNIEMVWGSFGAVSNS